MNVVSFRAQQQGHEIKFPLSSVPMPQQTASNIPNNTSVPRPQKSEGQPNVIIMPMPMDNFRRQGALQQKKGFINSDNLYKIVSLAMMAIFTTIFAISMKPTIQAYFRKNPNALFRSYTNDPEITKLSELPGMKDVKEIFQRKVINPMKNRELYEKEALDPGVTMLLTGPQGTGKTNFVYSAAKEVDALVSTIKLSEEGSSYINGTSIQIGEKIKAILAFARKHPEKEVFILLDEIEAIIGKTQFSHDHKIEDIKTILQILDDAKRVKNVRVFATTNERVNPKTGQIGNLDVNAVSRFLRVNVDNPDKLARKDAIKLYLSKHESCKEFLANADHLDEFAERTEGFSYRDLIQIKDNALEMLMNKKISAKEAGQNPDEIKLTRDLVMDALREFGKSKDNGRIFGDLNKGRTNVTEPPKGLWARFIAKYFNSKPAPAQPRPAGTP